MKMDKRLLVAVILIGTLLVSGCVEEATVLEGIEFHIKDAKYQLGDIITLSLETNETVENARIDIIDEENQILCTKYQDLEQGITEIEITGCEMKEKIIVSVSPPGRGIVTKEFTLETPKLELKQGYKYYYSTSHCLDCPKREVFIYVTKETDSQWEGISAIKTGNNVAFLMRWIIYKNNLAIAITMPLTEDKLTGEAEYIDVTTIPKLGEAGESMLPFWIILLKDMQGLDVNELMEKHKTTLIVEEQQQTVILTTKNPEIYESYMSYIIDIEVFKNEKLEDTGQFIASSSKPYLMIETNIGQGPRTSFKKIEKKEFSLDDFEGYSIHKYIISE